MTKSKEYWTKRALLREDEAALHSAELLEQLYSQHIKAAREIRKTIDTFILKYGQKYGMTYNQAAEYLSKKEMQEWKKTLGEYIEEIKTASDNLTKGRLTARLDALSTNSSIRRLDALIGEIECILTDLYSKTEAKAHAEMGDVLQESYYKKVYDIQSRAGYINQFAHLDEKSIEEILSYPWSGANFSERLWKNRDILAFNLRETLTNGFIQGTSNAQMAKALSDEMGKGFNAVETLIRTECSWLHGSADQRAYEAAGIEEYEFMATLDSRTSKKCADLDGETFPVKEAKVGVNYPPMHPRCRSTTIEHDPEEVSDWFKSGKEMPKDMTYKEWYKEQQKNNPELSDNFIEERRKKAYNKAKDEEQLARYTAVLGNDAPKKLSDFQDIKQNKPEYYRFLKLDYTRRNDLRNNSEKALPGADKASAAEAKFTKYLFNPENEVGFAKGKNFEDRLGYSADNWGELQKEILSRASLYPAKKKNEDKYGTRYEQKMVLYGKKGTPANVIVAWIHDTEGTRMTSAYIKEVEKNEN